VAAFANESHANFGALDTEINSNIATGSATGGPGVYLAI